MSAWIDKLWELKTAGERVAMVTVIGMRGSAPCEQGAKMIVSSNETFGTIGGGRLEYLCTDMARNLHESGTSQLIERFPLSASVGQCCGGVVDMLFEAVPDRVPEWLRSLNELRQQDASAVLCSDLGDVSNKLVVTEQGVQPDSSTSAGPVVEQARTNLRSYCVVQRSEEWFFELIGSRGFNIAIFGAGHVGSAVVQSLSMLDCQIRWIDSRPGVFGSTPENVQTIDCDSPAAVVDRMPAGSCYLVMTHDHDLDFDICRQILSRGDAAYCGLIGSLSKRQRFEKSFLRKGLDQNAIETLVCPIGVEGIRGKKPAEIAISVSAQVLQAFERLRRSTSVADFQ